MQEGWWRLEAPVHADTQALPSSRSELQRVLPLTSSPNLLSAASGYASTVCRFCSCSAVTFPFPGCPDLCVVVRSAQMAVGNPVDSDSLSGSTAGRAPAERGSVPGPCCSQALRCSGRGLWSCPSNDSSPHMTSMVAFLPSHRLRSSGKHPRSDSLLREHVGAAKCPAPQQIASLHCLLALAAAVPTTSLHSSPSSALPLCHSPFNILSLPRPSFWLEAANS